MKKSHFCTVSEPITWWISSPRFQSFGILVDLWVKRACWRFVLSPTGSFRAYVFWTLSEARSWLYQRRFLRPRPHFSPFFKIYMFFLCTIPDFCDFSSLRTFFFANFGDFLRIFTEESRFCKFSSNFNGSFPEFRTISIILQWVMPRLLSFRKLWENLQKIRRNFAANFLKICLKKK